MSGFSQRVELGRTGLEVSRIGVGSSYGPSRRACLRAFDAGVNYFFWGSTRTRGMALALRDLAPAHRHEMVVVLQAYVRSPTWLPRSIRIGLETLRLEHADVLLLGWHERAPPERLLEAAAEEQRRGRFRHLAISSHQRTLFPELWRRGRYDIFHLRYNAAHPGAEQDVFPHLPANAGPGIVSFTNTRWGDLLNPKKMPPGEAPLTATDCYRFSLSNPAVHVAIAGPSNDQQMDEALATLESGPMDADELRRARAIGQWVHDHPSFMDLFR